MRTPPTVATPEPLWDAKDVAAFLKVSRSWVYLHAEAGTLPSVKVGGLRRFVPAHVRAWATGEKPQPSGVVPFPPRGG